MLKCYDVYLFQVPVIDDSLKHLLFKAQYFNPLEVILKMMEALRHCGEIQQSGGP